MTLHRTDSSISNYSFLDLLNAPVSPQSGAWLQSVEKPDNVVAMDSCQTTLCVPTIAGNGDLLSPRHRRNSLASSSGYLSSDPASPNIIPDLNVWGFGGIDNNSNVSSASSGTTTTTTSSSFSPAPVSSRPSPSRKQASGKPKGSKLDRGSDRYKVRREKNNLSVRKSRAKTKSKILKIEERVQSLEDENKQLKLKLRNVRKFLSQFETSFLGWRNNLREIEQEICIL